MTAPGTGAGGPVLKAMKPSEEPIGVAGSSCEDGNIGFQIDPFARPDELRKSPGKDWQPVQGVGETAYFRNKADTYAELMVWSGAHHFTLQVGVPNGGSVESIRPRVIDLARAVIANCADYPLPRVRFCAPFDEIPFVSSRGHVVRCEFAGILSDSRGTGLAAPSCT